MNMKKSTLSAAVSIALGSVSFTASASLLSGATLSFTLGSTNDPNCQQPCVYSFTDIYGSYFAMDTNGNGFVDAAEKNPIGSYNGIVLGGVQPASGSHEGPVDGTENYDIDQPWTFFGGTGMHQTTSPITVTGGGNDSYTLDMQGWNMQWFGLNVPLVQTSDAVIHCAAGSSCSDTSSYTLDAAFHVNGAALTTVSYVLHLEGTVSYIPLPAAAWLFGSGLLGLASVTLHRKRRWSPALPAEG